MGSRRELRLEGVVQGVGLRPWVARRARAFGLAGTVRNTAGGLEIALEGTAEAIERFSAALRSEPPDCARIERVEQIDTRARGDLDFRIEASRGSGRMHTRIPPDLPVCNACLGEIFDPRDRRHRYAFAHCAGCGPRAALLLALPWDRERTSMRGFALCGACRLEYADASSRRYHAETIACPRCGPRLRALDGEGCELDGDPIERAAVCLRAGGIAALLGYGGFHLAVDATSEAAVARLRARKARLAKPFAVLVPDLAAARRIAVLRPEDERLLAGPTRPIVLAPRRDPSDHPLADAVAPGLRDAGLMLPFAPLHWLVLFGPGSHPLRDPARFGALVLTSANRSGEPTLHRTEEARARLRGIADLTIEHDRPVARPNDDPVFRSARDGPIPIRLSRSTAPIALRLPAGLRIPAPIVAVGGDLACAPALVMGNEVLVAEHIGDLADANAADALEARVAELCRLCHVAPEAAAHDLHPGYAGTELARRLAQRLWAVQHHHAHAVSCLVDNERSGPALALALDGLGYGLDGTAWGGELLRVDLLGCERLAHLEAVPLPGGDAAAREPWRMAAVWLARAFPDRVPTLPWHARRDPDGLRAVLAIAERAVASPSTTSCGRLFDAVASLLDLVDVAAHEGHAAATLEAAATSQPVAVGDSDPPLFDPSHAPEIPIAPLVRSIVKARCAGASTSALAAAFHAGLASRLATTAIGFARRLRLSEVALTGGCFQNRVLLEGVAGRLAAAGLVALRHRRVPPGDGGLAVGQAAIAAARLAQSAGWRPPIASGGAAGRPSRPA
jgi:hydrogenase maturation protein HypF